MSYLHMNEASSPNLRDADLARQHVLDARVKTSNALYAMDQALQALGSAPASVFAVASSIRDTYSVVDTTIRSLLMAGRPIDWLSQSDDLQHRLAEIAVAAGLVTQTTPHVAETKALSGLSDVDVVRMEPPYFITPRNAILGLGAVDDARARYVKCLQTRDKLKEMLAGALEDVRNAQAASLTDGSRVTASRVTAAQAKAAQIRQRWEDYIQLCSQMESSTFQGLGALPDPATAVKARLSTQAQQLRASASSVPFAGTMAAVAATRSELQGYSPWTDYVVSSPFSWIGLVTPYDPSQTIRSNLSDAEQIAGATFQQPVRQSGPIPVDMANPGQVQDTTPSVFTNPFAATPPSITREVATGFEQQHSGYAVMDPQFSPVPGAIKAVSSVSSYWKPVAVALGLGATAFYFGPAIRGASKRVGARLTAKPAPRKRNQPARRRRRYFR